MNDIVRCNYTGTALPLSTTTYNLFSTVLAMPGAGMHQMAGLDWYIAHIGNDAKGQLKGYRSQDRGTNWTQFYTRGVCPSFTDHLNKFAIPIGDCQDFKLDWVNGGTNQTSFLLDQTLRDINPLSTQDSEPFTYLASAAMDATTSYPWVDTSDWDSVSFELWWSAVAATNGTISFEGTDDPALVQNVVLVTPTVIHGNGNALSVSTTASKVMCMFENTPDFMRAVYTRVAGGSSTQMNARCGQRMR